MAVGWDGCLTRPLLATLLAAASTFLQGCDVYIPRHDVGYWETKPNYLISNVVTFNGTSSHVTELNSCNSQVPAALKCNGQGVCINWDPMDPSSAQFCMCSTYFAGPECTVQRKSQATAYTLSMFLGMFGADQFYLGYTTFGVIKLLTLGGFGFWWIFDIIRIGSTPVLQANSFEVANDVAHWSFILSLLTFFCAIAFGISIWSIEYHRKKKAHEVLLLQAEDMMPSYAPFTTASRLPLSASAGGYRGYGATIPGAVPASQTKV